jgi:hypothetical protein
LDGVKEPREGEGEGEGVAATALELILDSVVVVAAKAFNAERAVRAVMLHVDRNQTPRR